MSNDKPWPALMSCHSCSLTGLHGTCCTQKNIHPSSISTISKTSIFPELSSSKRVKALKRTQTRSSLMDVTWKKQEKWLQQQQPSKYQTKPRLRHNCHGTNKIHFDALSVQHLFGSGLPHKHVDHGQPDLWCTIFSTSTILITPSNRIKKTNKAPKEISKEGIWPNGIIFHQPHNFPEIFGVQKFPFQNARYRLKVNRWDDPSIRHIRVCHPHPIPITWFNSSTSNLVKLLVVPVTTKKPERNGCWGPVGMMKTLGFYIGFIVFKVVFWK